MISVRSTNMIAFRMWGGKAEATHGLGFGSQFSWMRRLPYKYSVSDGSPASGSGASFRFQGCENLRMYSHVNRLMKTTHPFFAALLIAIVFMAGCSDPQRVFTEDGRHASYGQRTAHRRMSAAYPPGGDGL